MTHGRAKLKKSKGKNLLGSETAFVYFHCIYKIHNH